MTDRWVRNHLLLIRLPFGHPIQQIQALTVAKDAERLQLLKEVAGTNVYEDRRKESLKIMEETGASSGALALILS